MGNFDQINFELSKYKRISYIVNMVTQRQSQQPFGLQIPTVPYFKGLNIFKLELKGQLPESIIKP